MITSTPKNLLFALLASAGLFSSATSLAATLQGAEIDNTATLSFTIGSTGLSLKSSPDGNTDLVGSGGTDEGGIATTF
jgi:hypothetical protein